MRSATFFPTYSQRENVVTNAVLVLFAQVHRLAPDVFSGLLTQLTDTAPLVEPQFFNQIADTPGPGIPDGLIFQAPFRIYLETKLGDTLDADQIARHCETIVKRDGGHSGSILIGLTRSPLDARVAEQLRQTALEKGVAFAGTTFSALADLVSQETAEFRLELNQLLEEFRLFLQELDLEEPSPNWLLVNPCGDTLEQNKRFNLYHDQPGRSKRYCKYLGCYRNKAVRLIGQVSKIVVAHVEGDALVVDENHPLPWIGARPEPLTEDETDRIFGIMADSPYPLRDQTVRYYLVDRFAETDFRKVTPSGIRGHRLFCLDDEKNEPGQTLAPLFQDGDPSLDDLAAALSRSEWT